MFATPGDLRAEVAALSKKIDNLNEQVVRMDKKIVRLTVLVEGRRGGMIDNGDE